MKIALFDLDGVLANFFDAAKEYCMTQFNKDLSQYWLRECLSEEEYNKTLSDLSLFNSLNPEPGAAETVKQLKDLGYSIHVVSNRTFPIIHTVKWLIRNDIPFDEVFHESNEKRIIRAREFSPVLSVEDDFINAVKFAQYCNYSFLINKPWNDFAGPDNIIRVNSIEEILKWLS